MKGLVSKLVFIKNIGWPFFLFRFIYEIKKKAGYFKLRDGQILNRLNKLSVSNLFELKLVNRNIKFFGFKIKSDNAIDGQIYTFSNKELNYAPDGIIAWNYNPVSENYAPENVLWYKIPDFGNFGDIKLIWEASRFPHLFHFICAYTESNDPKYGQAARNTIIDWIDKNPYPFGVNYKCGQEISFRFFAWIITLDYFSEFFSVDDKTKITQNILISLKRINLNYSYASKWVRNNHSISEAAGMLIIGLLFPDYCDSERTVKKATKYIEKELSYQVFKDGAYIQNSFNYQRLVIDVLSFVILLSKRKKYKLPVYIYEQHFKLTQFLASFVMHNGKVPNYGPNDGAMLFPISDYHDYRTSLNFASLVNNGTVLYNSNFELCNFFGLCHNNADILTVENRNFPISGYYQLKNNFFNCFIRCHSYKTRPAHSDTMHLDIWVNGANISCDTGSFSYNTTKENKMHFSGIQGHNTLVIDNRDYMTPVFNFGKTNWPRVKVNYADGLQFEGEHYGYKSINNVVHKRQVVIMNNELIVKDTISGMKKPVIISQHWHSEYNITMLNDNIFKVMDLSVESNIKGIVKASKVSRNYNDYTNIQQLIFNTITDQEITIETKFIYKK